MKYLLIAFAALMLPACNQQSQEHPKANPSDTSKWISSTLFRLLPSDKGWNIAGFSGGSGIEGAHYQFSLIPNEKSASDAKSEFRPLLKQQLQKDGYKIIGEGSGTGSNGVESFSFSVQSDFYTGTIYVVFGAPTKVVPGLVAIAQVQRY